jgi:glycosyltransferase involved in cell wall biosynthesis
VCFLGSTRYSRPLDQTSEKKFRLLSALGQLFVVSFNQHLRPCMFREHASFYLMPGIHLPVVRYVEMFTLAPCLTLWLIFRHDIQILVAQSPYEGFAAALAKTVANGFGRRVVLVVESHGDFEESLFLQRRVFFHRIYRCLMKRAARYALIQADLLRAISGTTRRQLERWTSGKPIFLFPTWTDIEVFFQANAPKKVLTGQDILYAGVLTPLKGVHHLINAFATIAKDFPHAKLIIIGREENKTYSTGLKHLINTLGLEGRVQFIAELSQRKLAVWMGKARVLMLPSISEGLGRVVIEAMAAGTPVIGSDVGGISEIVEDGATGFRVSPGDEMGLADRLRWILEHPEEALDMGHRAQDLAKKLFSAEGYIQVYQRIFEAAQVLSARNAHHAPSTL